MLILAKRQTNQHLLLSGLCDVKIYNLYQLQENKIRRNIKITEKWNKIRDKEHKESPV